jgi:hypothetical protein
MILMNLLIYFYIKIVIIYHKYFLIFCTVFNLIIVKKINLKILHIIL